MLFGDHVLIQCVNFEGQMVAQLDTMRSNDTRCVHQEAVEGWWGGD